MKSKKMDETTQQHIVQALNKNEVLNVSYLELHSIFTVLKHPTIFLS